MEKKIIYLKAEQSSYVNHGKIHIGDIASVFCEDKEIEKKIKNIVLYEFDEKNEKEGRVFLSILLLIEKISEQIPYGEVRNTGETDMVIYYKAEELKSKKWVQVIKILFICATCFFGAGITVMGYNNDVDMVKVFGQLYKVFLGTKPDDPTFVELFYSVGLALGIFLFFNHVPGKKVTNEPTPIQVQMRLYEQDVNRTFLLGASRKGEELDVSGNNDSANKVILGWVAFGAGFAVAGGFIAFISLIGIVTRLAGLTKTADAIPTYENSMALGLIFFNLVSLYQPDLQWISYTAALSIINIVGLFTGIFAGCLAGALAEVVNIIPIFSRRIKLRKGFPYMVKAAAVGKCIGCLIQFYVF